MYIRNKIKNKQTMFECLTIFLIISTSLTIKKIYVRFWTISIKFFPSIQKDIYLFLLHFQSFNQRNFSVPDASKCKPENHTLIWKMRRPAKLTTRSENSSQLFLCRFRTHSLEMGSFFMFFPFVKKPKSKSQGLILSRVLSEIFKWDKF